MGLAVNQIRLLTLTQRKSDLEFKITIDTNRKAVLTSEQSDLSRQYYAKLQSAQIAYYSNGKYNAVNYNYLMGYDSWSSTIYGDKPLKSDNSTVLTDANGQVVLSAFYADALKSVLGASCMDGFGRGGTFSTDKIPEILAEIVPGYDAEDFAAVIKNENIKESTYNANKVNLYSGESNGTTTVNNTDQVRTIIEQIVDFYYPIFQAAAANGWTTEYNEQIAQNQNYISDALLSGTLQLANVGNEGCYEPDTSLSYFVMQGDIQQRTDSDTRELITAWYNSEKERIAEKENILDIEIRDYSTELEATNTEMKAIEQMLQKTIGTIFDWGGK